MGKSAKNREEFPSYCGKGTNDEVKGERVLLVGKVAYANRNQVVIGDRGTFGVEVECKQ